MTKPPFSAFAFILLFTLIVGPVLQGCVKAPDRLAVETLPFTADAFDIRSDSDGNLHVVYALAGKLFFAIRKRGLKDFSQPVLINPKGPAITLESIESGPKIAPGPDGSINIVWKSENDILFSRSIDVGLSWTMKRIRDHTDPGEADLPAIAVGLAGTIYIIWTDTRGADISEDRYTANIFLDWSGDGGKTFRKAFNLTGDKVQACPCCQPRISVLENGVLLIAYRSSEKSIKDIHLLRYDPEKNRGEIAKVSENNWFFVGCPTSGPSLSVGSDQRTVKVAWTAENVVYSTSSVDGGRTFKKQITLGRGRYHEIETAKSGTGITVWDMDGATWYKLDSGKKALRLENSVILPGKVVAASRGGFALFIKQ